MWLTELAGLDGPDLVPYALARSLGVYDRPEGSIQDALVAHLRDRELLLVLDDCEHLLAACRDLVTALVSGCDGVRVLCTSRERLSVPGEATVVLPALELPAVDAQVLVAGLADAEALRLLADRAVAVAPDTFARGILSTLLGILEWPTGDPQAAEAKIKEAVRSHDRTGHRWGMATSLDALAWAAGSSGRPERAALLLGARAAVFRELGATLPPYWQAYHDDYEAAARAALDQGRYRACWRDGYALSRDQAVAAALEDEAIVPAARPAPAVTAAEDAFELSARELEVARLVADGLPNPAIASALFVSVATVKTHVSHILAKLGLDSRTQLARWVAGHDLGPPAPARR